MENLIFRALFEIYHYLPPFFSPTRKSELRNWSSRDFVIEIALFLNMIGANFSVGIPVENAFQPIS